MKALTIEPGVAASLRLDELAAPPPEAGRILAQTVAIGVCGTDREILAGQYGEAPAGAARLIIGHESLARVVEAPADCGFAPGDLIVGIVRKPDPVPCRSCAVGEWDMCKNGLFTEHGIKGLHGFAAEQIRLEPERAVKVPSALGLRGVLIEPTSIVAKAWEQIARIGSRASWSPARVVVSGAGTIGLLATLIARQRGFETHVYDLATTGIKPRLVRALGAHYHCAKDGALDQVTEDADVVLECTGVGQLVLDAMESNASDGIVCLTGVSPVGRTIDLDIGAFNRRMVLENSVVFGSVNANRRHYVAALEALEAADPNWLDALITRRVPLRDYPTAFLHPADDIKTALLFDGA